jgi:hypothetical protein
MKNLPTASPEEQQAVLKAAEQRYAQLGIPTETARVLFQNEVNKYAQQMLGSMQKEGQLVESLNQGTQDVGRSISDFWGSLPPMVRQGLVNALIGGGIGALGGAGYGALQGQDPGKLARRGAGYGAIAGAATPVLSNILNKYSGDLDSLFNTLVKSATEHMVKQGFSKQEAEQILLVKLQKTAAEQLKGDKGDYHTNPKGAYPQQVMASGKKKSKPKEDKQRKVKKLASDLTEAIKAAKCSKKHNSGSKKSKKKSKSNKKKES